MDFNSNRIGSIDISKVLEYMDKKWIKLRFFHCCVVAGWDGQFMASRYE